MKILMENCVSNMEVTYVAFNKLLFCHRSRRFNSEIFFLSFAVSDTLVLQ